MVRNLVAVLLMMTASSLSLAEEGGVKDSSGLVWSQSQYKETLSWWDWNSSTTNAANYVVVDVDANGNTVAYDDWRLPTIREVRAAIQDGALAKVMPIMQYPNGQYYCPTTRPLIWTSETRGTKAFAVQLVRDPNYPWTLNASSSGSTYLALKGSGFDVHFVRGKPPVK